MPPCVVAPATIGTAVGRRNSSVVREHARRANDSGEYPRRLRKCLRKASGETFSEPATRVVLASIVSEKFTPVASSGPALLMLTS